MSNLIIKIKKKSLKKNDFTKWHEKIVNMRYEFLKNYNNFKNKIFAKPQ